jgi:uncharacterized membrane protein YfcA
MKLISKKNCLYTASSLMILVGLLRGFGGLFLFTGGVETTAVNTAPWKMTAASISLLTVALLLIVSACLLLVKKNKTMWILCWISVCLFIIGGLVNGFLLFGSPQAGGQIINCSVSAVICLLLWLGRNFKNEKIIK